MKILSILLFTLCFSANVCAENAPKAKKLVGVWQQVQKSPADGHTMRLPVWKVMQADGSFCTFLIANPQGQSIITNEGSFKVENDSVFIEHITGSVTDPGLIGKDNHLTFKFEGNDKISVSYNAQGAMRAGNETWIRVKLETPED